MIHAATQVIKNTFVEKELHHQVHEFDEFSAVECGFMGDNCAIRVNFVSTDEDCDVKLLSMPIARFPVNRLSEGYGLMNE